MKKPFRKISILIVLFSLFGIQNAASQGYVKLNALYALVGVVNPSVEFAISPKSTLQTDIVVSPWKSIGERWLLDAFFGWAWMDSHYNGYSFDGKVDMYPHRPVQPENPDPFNGSSEWYPNKIGVSIGYRIFTPRNKQRTADVR